MFSERLTEEQVEEFAIMLAEQHEGMERADWKIDKWKTQDGKAWVVQVKCENCEAYNMEMRLNDYGVYLWESGLLFRGWIIKKYVQFMYHTFGEEYKQAYLADAMKLFEEE